MAGCYLRLDGREFEWTPGVGDGQGGLACCNSWGRKESDTTEQLNWTELRASANFLSSSSFVLLHSLPSFSCFIQCPAHCSRCVGFMTWVGHSSCSQGAHNLVMRTSRKEVLFASNLFCSPAPDQNWSFPFSSFFYPLGTWKWVQTKVTIHL